MSRSSTMPFGKYCGHEIADLPNDYLRWLLTIELRDWLYDAVASEYRRRLDEDDQRQERRTPPPPSGSAIHIQPEQMPLARRVFDAGYRVVAHAVHPDHGGDTDEMQRLNLLAESLRSQLGATK